MNSGVKGFFSQLFCSTLSDITHKTTHDLTHRDAHNTLHTEEARGYTRKRQKEIAVVFCHHFSSFTTTYSTDIVATPLPYPPSMLKKTYTKPK